MRHRPLAVAVLAAVLAPAAAAAQVVPALDAWTAFGHVEVFGSTAALFSDGQQVRSSASQCFASNVCSSLRTTFTTVESGLLTFDVQLNSSPTLYGGTGLVTVGFPLEDVFVATVAPRYEVPPSWLVVAPGQSTGLVQVSTRLAAGQHLVRAELYSNDLNAPMTFVVGNFAFTSDVTTVPEPATLALTGAGLAGLAFLARRRRAS